ncbi:uncharacterized protein LOC130799241 [Amaranthus tricolor]|uniref:uncharacterized protein LOC130799241 n=1 Tax=Amaranthus tricolor TaxID=29722 RepID=UPI00258DBE16|nr:uncharacterized protein LOC130799241 [Amaranthus tricolor]
MVLARRIFIYDHSFKIEYERGATRRHASIIIEDCDDPDQMCIIGIAISEARPCLFVYSSSISGSTFPFLVVNQFGYNFGSGTDFENLGNDVDYFDRFVTDREFESELVQNQGKDLGRMNQIYNVRQSIRREEMGGRTPLQHCLYMATEHNYVVWTDVDSEGQLSRLLIANPTSIQMIRSWPHVVLIDTTYKTNKQKWPQCEIIGMTPTNHNFLVAFYLMRDEAVQKPDVIVTDRDEGLSAAISVVYPGVRHLLCLWHIGNDVENMIDKLCGGKKNQQGQIFRQAKWNPLVNSLTIPEFENRWEGIVSSWSIRNRKYYLGSGNSSFDALFKRAHAQITNQQSRIRQALEESRNSISGTSRLNFLRLLYRHVFIFALEQLMMEHNRMSNGALYLDDIHPFWRTLKYLEPEEDASEEVRHANADDKEYFQSLVDEVLRADPSVVRCMSQVLEQELHPDGADMPESQANASSRRDFSHFPWPDYIPFILPPYLFDWIDVIGDGNCGFRTIAVTELGGEEAWPLLRRAMSLKMEKHREQYERVYLSDDLVEENRGNAWHKQTYTYSLG